MANTIIEGNNEDSKPNLETNPYGRVAGVFRKSIATLTVWYNNYIFHDTCIISSKSRYSLDVLYLLSHKDLFRNSAIRVSCLLTRNGAHTNTHNLGKENACDIFEKMRRFIGTKIIIFCILWTNLLIKCHFNFVLNQTKLLNIL